MHYLSILSTMITFIFAAAVFNRYQSRRGPYLLIWTFGLILYGIGTLTEVWLGFTFNAFALRLWYLSGAMLTAAWLGQGTVHLLVRRAGVANALGIGLGLVSLAAIGLVFAAPVNASAAAAYNLARPVSEQYKEILTRSGAITLLTILLNIYGTLTLVGGALYSSFLFWRKSVLASRMLGNILIAGGALLPALAGTFVKAGLVDALYISELLGVIIMFAGFLQATAGKSVEARSARTVQSGASD
jgi:hypothetical protein